MAALAWLSLPLGFATAGLVLTTSLPRYAVSYYLGHEALGALAVAGALTVAMGLVVGAMSQAAGPRLAFFHAAGDTQSFVRLLAKLLALVAAAGMAMLGLMALCGGPVLGLLYGNQFVEYANLAVWLTLAAALKDLGTPFSRALSSMRCFRSNMAVRIAGIALLGALLPRMVGRFGLTGAAWAMSIAWLFALVLSAMLVRRILVRGAFSQKATGSEPRIGNVLGNTGPVQCARSGFEEVPQRGTLRRESREILEDPCPGPLQFP